MVRGAGLIRPTIGRARLLPPRRVPVQGSHVDRIVTGRGPSPAYRRRYLASRPTMDPGNKPGPILRLRRELLGRNGMSAFIGSRGRRGRTGRRTAAVTIIEADRQRTPLRPALGAARPRSDGFYPCHASTEPGGGSPAWWVHTGLPEGGGSPGRFIDGSGIASALLRERSTPIAHCSPRLAELMISTTRPTRRYSRQGFVGASVSRPNHPPNGRSKRRPRRHTTHSNRLSGSQTTLLSIPFVAYRARYFACPRASVTPRTSTMNESPVHSCHAEESQRASK
jgi:hypothetical protein